MKHQLFILCGQELGGTAIHFKMIHCTAVSVTQDQQYLFALDHRYIDCSMIVLYSHTGNKCF